MVLAPGSVRPTGGGAMSTEGWLAAGFGAVLVLLLFATAIY
jgi:hypothetical protein